MSKEKELTAAQLAEREALARQLEEEKKHLVEETTHLKGDLMVSVLEQKRKTNHATHCFPLSSVSLSSSPSPFFPLLVS